MATLQKIRNRAGLLIALIIGVAIFAFVLQDILTSGKSLRRQSRMQLAEINGKAISYEEYVNRIDKLAEFYRLRFGLSSLDEEMMEGVREEAWESLIREYTTKDEYKTLGIAVSTDELMDMVQGRNPHPIIRQLFSDPQTGILNRSFLLQFIRTMNEDPSGAQKTIWLHLENQIINDKEFTKFNNLIRKGLYVTSMEAEEGFIESDKKVDFSYIFKYYGLVSDSAISYNESDLLSYYHKNQNRYKQNASRDLEYVVFEVIPSKEDDQQAQDFINRLKGEFETTDDVVSLVNLESDITYDDRNYTYGELSDMLNDFMFSAKPGDVYGPYYENESYRLARLVEINYLPDSVKARHILLQPDQTTNIDQLKKVADSLKQLIENGTDFASLAMIHSADGSAQDGGDLGWFREGNMVQPFNDACFEGAKGDIDIVESKFGVHIIEILDQSPDVKKVKVAVLSRKVEPSSKTYQGIYSNAIEFAGNNNTYSKFEKAIAEQNLTKRYASELLETERNIPGLENPREMIRWAFEAKLNDVSTEIFEFSNKFVIAAVTGIREEGIAPLDQVRSEIELEVKKNKKGEIIAGEFSSHLKAGTTLQDLASSMDLNIQEASGVSFNSVSIPGSGMEPKVIGAACGLDAGEMSIPIQGNNGVYVLVVNNINKSETINADFTRSRLTMMLQSRAYSEAYQALREASDIKDNRARFF